MGFYLNPGSAMFRRSLRSKIYVDKSGLIAKMNDVIGTEQNYVCVSRPRRFGKSMAANMLATYYGRGEDTSALFQNLEISADPSFSEHRNQYNVIRLNMQEFLSVAGSADHMLDLIQQKLEREFLRSFPTCRQEIEGQSLVSMMQEIYLYSGYPFVILLDEWDCLFREYPKDRESQKNYLDFLRGWLKDQEYVALAYMTGILPIKKYGTHSALNMFTEYSMTDPGNLAPFFGFTESEVQALCKEYQMDFEEAKNWYNGYDFSIPGKSGSRRISMYSPKSVVEAMLRHRFEDYWNRTETYEALKIYIQMDLDGLKTSVIEMLGGKAIPINTGTFSNDMTTFTAKDDVLTLLVHLGYLSYHMDEGTVSIRNKEVSLEYLNAISTMDWAEVIRSIQASRKLLEALWNMDAEAVAEGIEQAHNEISILEYNDENSLSCTIQLAFYFAREYYTLVRELPAGKGFADLCLIPRKTHPEKPAVIIELKWDSNAAGAIRQIREKQYPEALKDYRGNLLLAGINYDKKTKRHSCVIEKEEWSPE